MRRRLRRSLGRAPVVDTAALQSNFDALRSLGFLKERVDVAKYVDMSYIKEAGARLK